MSRKLLIFDLDGTLVESGRTVLTLLNEMRNEADLEPMSLEDIIPILSLGGIEMVKVALQLQDEKEAAREIVEFRRRYALIETPSDCVYPGVHTALTTLRAEGYILCVCTNKPRILADKVLRDTDLGSHFGFVICGDDLATRKPDPSNLQACLNHFSTTFDHALLIGDSTIDQIISQRASVPLIFFTEGYNDGVDPSRTAAAFSKYENLPDVVRSLQ